MSDWAEEKARKWVAGVAEHECGSYIGSPCPTCDYHIPRLAALLREVDVARLVRCCVCEDAAAPRPDCECVICSKRRVIADVRRVVEEVGRRVPRCPGLCCDEILSRLEKLK